MNDTNDLTVEPVNTKEGEMTMKADENHENGTESTPPETVTKLAMSVELPLHPYCSMFPQASESEIETLAEDIRRNGLHEEIVRHQGQILDGRNRELACKKAGVEPKYVEYAGDASDDGLFQFVISKNARRRHLRDSQKALIAARLSMERKGKSKDPQICGLLTQLKAAEIMGVSTRLVQDATRLLRENKRKIIAEVERGEKALHVALKECKSEKTEASLRAARKTDTEPEKQEEIDGEELTITPKNSKSNPEPSLEGSEQVPATPIPVAPNGVVPLTLEANEVPEKSEDERIDEFIARTLNPFHKKLSYREGQHALCCKVIDWLRSQKYRTPISKRDFPLDTTIERSETT